MMQGWAIKKLGEICEIINGGTPKSNVKEYWDGDVQWLTPSDMGKLNSPIVFNTSRKITSLGLAKSSAKLFPEFSVILSTRAPIGHLAINKVPMSTNQGCRGIVPNQVMDVWFLYYFLKKNVELLNSLGTGTTFKELSKNKLAEIAISYPPLPIQKQIVQILNEAFAAIDKAKANIQKNIQNAEELFRAKSMQLFATALKVYPEKSIDELCKVERGSSPRPIQKYITNNVDGVNWIKIGDVSDRDKYVVSTRQKITKEGAKKSRFVDIGDFILSNSMSYGRPYIMKIQGYIHDGWFVLRLPESLDSEYFWHILASPYLREQFENLAAGAIVKNISSDLVKKATIPLPPLEEQKNIVITIEKIKKQVDNLIQVYKMKMKGLDGLKKSLLHKAFSGELTKEADINQQLKQVL